MAICRPTLFDNEGNFTCSFYNYKFSGCTQNVVYTLATKSFDDLEIVYLGRKPALATIFLSVRQSTISHP
jgi:hypothetical protein